MTVLALSEVDQPFRYNSLHLSGQFQSRLPLWPPLLRLSGYLQVWGAARVVTLCEWLERSVSTHHIQFGGRGLAF